MKPPLLLGDRHHLPQPRVDKAFVGLHLSAADRTGRRPPSAVHLPSADVPRVPPRDYTTGLNQAIFQDEGTKTAPEPSERKDEGTRTAPEPSPRKEVDNLRRMLRVARHIGEGVAPHSDGEVFPTHDVRRPRPIYKEH
ncbi:unnamed protein product [Heligmosomoides polygyrus]|uniref:WH2 domain-containing protein n=1 Tax=Heligmosomoides polygyrus TaxID=6339 RepID=A0A183GQS7_HELPZ|nr:unnamed protein product [Heligmosomoides polygyrus]